ncbi:MAG: DNA-processing protein DprA [Bacteroidales bacterium]|nr:DNA-processing protein DprA [Bacteroidales bacterium]MDD3522640.1 DNA-processing protein DprA [Bacteroidales bacterium]MDD4030279.1 DNA-processing protein DprA [Bacteroidales bacterium]MDD4435014.1 DNA-processing protein DprA [Bacteroidales bacterium]
MICAEEEIGICALSLCLRYEGGLARRLYDHYGSACSVFNQPLAGLVRHKGMRRSIVEKMMDPALFNQAAGVLEWLKSVNIRAIPLYHQDYPYRLRECPDAPLLLYVAGQAVLNQGPVLSVVGTRKATSYGKSLCVEIIAGFKPLGIKPVIVSGLAFGIDVTAHRAALENDLVTVAVLPTGIDTIYPSAHLDIAAQILERGAVLSEFPPDTQGNRHNFLQRNRIIAGLSDATLVVESKADGGAQITAHLALDYSRDVLALPGRPSDICSQGCNNLIRMNKAALVTSARDIADVLQWDVSGKGLQAVQQELFESLDEQDRHIINHIRENSGDINDMGESLNIPFPELSARLVQLQVRGVVDCLANKEYISRI